VRLGWGMVCVCVVACFGWSGGYDCIGVSVSCEVARAVVGCVEMLRDMGLSPARVWTVERGEEQE